MGFTYKPLFKLLIDRSMKKTDLIEKVGISRMTLAKFAKNEYVSMDILDRICKFFNCQIGDIIEYIND
jgi:DNA-binding Xre family transcriptional regulator